jgi:hypothetical protein
VGSVDIETAIGWRGRTVLDQAGRKVGRLEEVYLDRDTDRPAWAALHTGLFGLRRTFVPLAGAQPAGKDVQLPWPEELIKNAPNANPDVTLSEEEEDRLYSHYGVTEPESTQVQEYAKQRDDDTATQGSSTPARSPDGPDAVAHDRDVAGHMAERDSVGSDEMPSVVRSEEELRVGKKQVASRLRLKKYVVNDEEVVPVRREEVRIERVGDEGSEPEVLFDSADERQRS